ncbi:Ig-like domain-containing protein [Bacillus subtilis]
MFLSQIKFLFRAILLPSIFRGGPNQHEIREPLATSFASDNSYVASVSSRGIITANHKGNATITLFKSNGSALGAVYVTVE